MKKRLLKVIFILILGILILYGYSFFILHFPISIPCLFHLFTGYYCPGCGITRCLLALIHLEFREAIQYNILVVILLPFLLSYEIYKIYLYVANKKDNFICRIPNMIWFILIGITLLFGILRNLETFSYLAP